MKVRRMTTSGKYQYGTSRAFNTFGIGEVICYFKGDCTSEFISNLEVQVPKSPVVFKDKRDTLNECNTKPIWKSMSQAFSDKDIIADNYNTTFDVPHSKLEYMQGFNF